MTILEHTISKPVIDLSTADGNVFFLISQAVRLSKILERDSKPILNEMTSSNYQHAVYVFDKEFGDFIDLKLPASISHQSLQENVKNTLKAKNDTVLRNNMTSEKMDEIYSR